MIVLIVLFVIFHLNSGRDLVHGGAEIHVHIQEDLGHIREGDHIPDQDLGLGVLDRDQDQERDGIADLGHTQDHLHVQVQPPDQGRGQDAGEITIEVFENYGFLVNI